MENPPYFDVGKKTVSVSERYREPYTFYEALKNLEPAAIVHLRNRIWPALQKWGAHARVNSRDLQEIAQDAVVLTLQKIESGAFRFEGADPAAYTATIAKNLLRNFLRKNRAPLTELGDWDAHAEAEVEKYLFNKELQLRIAGFLDKMKDNCRQLIRFRYYDGYGDQELIARQLTPYATVDSLRSKRNACLKKLGLLMEEIKNQLLYA